MAQKTAIGTARLQEAQDVAGLSNERLARRLHVATKTWERWKKAGEVPTYALGNLGQVLGIEIRQSAPLILDGDVEDSDLAAIRHELAETRASLARIEQQLAELLPPPRRPRGR